jgi:hypothetical protein
MKFDVLKTAHIRSRPVVFWEMTECILVDKYNNFRQCYAEGGDSILKRNVLTYVPKYSGSPLQWAAANITHLPLLSTECRCQMSRTVLFFIKI